MCLQEVVVLPPGTWAASVVGLSQDLSAPDVAASCGVRWVEPERSLLETCDSVTLPPTAWCAANKVLYCWTHPCLFFFFFWLSLSACGILVPQPGIKSGGPSLTHWTARKFPDPPLPWTADNGLLCQPHPCRVHAGNGLQTTPLALQAVPRAARQSPLPGPIPQPSFWAGKCSPQHQPLHSDCWQASTHTPCEQSPGSSSPSLCASAPPSRQWGFTR